MVVNIIVTIMKWRNIRFSVIKSKVRINVNRRFAFKDAADAHRALEARATSGSPS